MWTRLVRTSDPGQWFGKIQGPVTRVQHLVRTNSYVNATVSLVHRYGADLVCMKKRELTQDPDCTLALQHVLDLLTWASYPGQIFPVWTQVNISDDNLMMWNTWTTDPGAICEHGLILTEDGPIYFRGQCKRTTLGNGCDDHLNTNVIGPGKYFSFSTPGTKMDK